MAVLLVGMSGGGQISSTREFISVFDAAYCALQLADESGRAASGAGDAPASYQVRVGGCLIVEVHVIPGGLTC